MKTCEDYIADMNLSIDGLLTPEEEQALQAHLAVCPKCRSLYQSYQDIQAAIDEAEVEPPKGLAHSVMTQIHQEKVRHSPKATLKRMRFTLVAAVLALVVIAAGKYIGTPHGNTAASSTPETAAAEAPAEAAANPEAALAAPPEEAAGAAAENATAAADEDIVGYADAAVPPKMGAGNSAMEDTAPSDQLMILWNAMQQDGDVGSLYLVDTTETELFQLLPNTEIVALSSGDIVYKVSASDYALVADQLPAVESMEAATESDDIYLSLN